jgi:MFS transporter, putative metabolite transport protein
LRLALPRFNGEEGAMANITTPIPNVVALKRSVQDHIDELPMWADGNKLPSVPMTGMQWLIWSLAAVGKFSRATSCS